jgi:hypothetical protein
LKDAFACELVGCRAAKSTDRGAPELLFAEGNVTVVFLHEAQDKCRVVLDKPSKQFLTAVAEWNRCRLSKIQNVNRMLPTIHRDNCSFSWRGSFTEDFLLSPADMCPEGFSASNIRSAGFVVLPIKEIEKRPGINQALQTIT